MPNVPSSTPACSTIGCPRFGMPAGYVTMDDGTEQPRGGRCPACDEMTNPLLVDGGLPLGGGCLAYVRYDHRGRAIGWAILDGPDGEPLAAVETLELAFGWVAEWISR